MNQLHISENSAFERTSFMKIDIHPQEPYTMSIDKSLKSRKKAFNIIRKMFKCSIDGGSVVPYLTNPSDNT